MNREQAKKIAKRMVAKRVTVYAGRVTVHNETKIPLKMLTESAMGKIMNAFYREVIGSRKYPAIETLFAEDKVRG